MSVSECEYCLDYAFISLTHTDSILQWSSLLMQQSTHFTFEILPSIVAVGQMDIAVILYATTCGCIIFVMIVVFVVIVVGVWKCYGLAMGYEVIRGFIIIVI